MQQRKIRQRDLVPNLAKRIAEELAPKTYTAYPVCDHEILVRTKTPRVVGGIGIINEQGRPVMETEVVTRYGRVATQYPVNHERRLRRLGNKAGINAMFNYAADNGYKPEIDHLATR